VKKQKRLQNAEGDTRDKEEGGGWSQPLDFCQGRIGQHALYVALCKGSYLGCSIPLGDPPSNL